jgi:lipoprotein-anchoring transpeptidase ErfK/SrfK
MDRGSVRRMDRRALLRLAALGVAGAAAGGALALPEPADAQELDVPVYLPRNIGRDEHWVAVNLSYQATVGMIGRGWVHRAWSTTGKDGWETPEGEFRINRRVYNETMTSAAIGIPEGPDSYVLTDVLYTQYFTYEGHALHLNYWRPNWVFGAARTSAGCVGMRYDDAAFFWRHVGMGNRVVIFS